MLPFTTWLYVVVEVVTTPLPPLAADPAESGYRIVQVTAHLTGGTGRPAMNTCKAARIHLRWRDQERRFVVVGLERDE